ncbi:excinuclease ABC subunit UvrA [candidate division CSSED10-310 bacterium]|uniref:UvrABC system protein A n=1 Tax=candidate division CSSED10-310 bacterium TaxID=2855610 RepID=A0ABV6YUA2_UNCC1
MANSGYIIIKGAREHNLKNIDLQLPRNSLIVFTGVSGSGKSSLAFDTIYAEGQRRYVESLSSYARQFLGQMEKPRVDFIEGLSPAISIEQKTASHNPRSTVGTVTEIYDYLRVLMARAGLQYCHQCGQPIGSQTVDHMADSILSLPEKSKILVLSPQIEERKGEHRDIIENARKEGFVRIRINGKVVDLFEKIDLDQKRKHTIELVVDRLIIRENIRSRLCESIELALKLSQGLLKVAVEQGEEILFSEKRACSTCGISFEQLTPQRFSFNSPLGMCTQCGGLGTIDEVDPNLVIVDPKRSIMEGAIAVWKDFEKRPDSWNLRMLKQIAKHYQFSLYTPFQELPSVIQKILLFGSDNQKVKIQWNSEHSTGIFYHAVEGVIPRLTRLYMQTNSEELRKHYSSFMNKKDCPQCNGARLRPESRAVRYHDSSIVEITEMSVQQCYQFFEHLALTDYESEIVGELVSEIKARLRFLLDVGLHYLTLDRNTPTLSGGEAQRIRLASQIGSGLVGVLYTLDEPSIGLHQRDNDRLLNSLFRLKDLGNTVIVVEHDPEAMQRADMIVDFGPGAGHRGGQIVAQGSPEEIKKCRHSLTGLYLARKRQIPILENRRTPRAEGLKIIGAAENNLKNIDVFFPLGVFTCVTGVSGSGKSSLVNNILYNGLSRKLYRSRVRPGQHQVIEGINLIDKVINIDQKPIGRTPRSNPATYVKVFDHIRSLFSKVPQARARGYKPGRFSFNVKGGRCESCTGDGLKKIEMHFLPDVYITCSECKGKRFNQETLQIQYKGKNIAEVLNMEVEEALDLFGSIPHIKRILQTLKDVGLDYIKLGQPATTLSGGEAQRVKLAKELCKKSTGRTVYILDEPTTGLHFADIEKLLHVLNRLVEEGNTVIVIEHNLDVIKCADYIIDLGPEGGDQGGTIVAQGIPEDVAQSDTSFTGEFLKGVLDLQRISV